MEKKISMEAKGGFSPLHSLLKTFQREEFLRNEMLYRGRNSSGKSKLLKIG